MLNLSINEKIFQVSRVSVAQRNYLLIVLPKENVFNATQQRQSQSVKIKLINFLLSLQFVYDCDPIQLTFLRLLSNRAKQVITYHCLNSSAWFKQSTGSYEYSIKLKAENGIEIYAQGTIKYKPTILLDECKVRVNLVILVTFRCQLTLHVTAMQKVSWLLIIQPLCETQIIQTITKET